MRTLLPLLLSLSLSTSTLAADLVTISDAWVRPTVPGARVSAAYMRIAASEPVRLVKVELPTAGHVEIHDMKMNGGVMEMRAVTGVDVAKGKPVELKPGGLHVMLMQLKSPITVGEKYPLTLTFETAGKKTQVVKVDATAQDPAARR